MSTKISDPKLYRQMSEPHESSDVANAALEKFYAMVREARKECKIRDVLIVCMDSCVYESGEADFISIAENGSESNMLSMAAYAHGKLDAMRREIVNQSFTKGREGK